MATEKGDLQFVTGDPEVDELEKRLADGSISDEEVDKILAGWSVPRDTPAEDLAAVDELGDGFSDGEVSDD